MAYEFCGAQSLPNLLGRPLDNPETEITWLLFQRLLSTGKSGCPLKSKI
jgi:hypothetical protein